MTQTNEQSIVKDADRIIEALNASLLPFTENLRRAQQSIELFGFRLGAAFNPMNRYRWPGKARRA